MGDNWALKSSNLRKLVRNLDHYFKTILAKDATELLAPLDVLALAKDAPAQKPQIATLVELLAAAAVSCPQKAIYVTRIMEMSAEHQVEMKNILQMSLGRLVEYTGPLDDDHLDNDHEEEEEADMNEMVFGQDEEDEEDGARPQNLFGSGNHHLSMSSPAPLSNVARLEEELEQSRRQVASLKSQMQLQQQDYERAEEKLRVMVEDLQGRLVQRQDELIQVEEDLQKAVAELEDTKSKLVDALEESTRLADDLDVAQAKAHQLTKVEATLQIYKKKLEDAGGVTQQMRDAEDLSANYLEKLREMETKVARMSTLQKQVEQLSEQVRRLEKERDNLELQQQSSVSDISELKGQLKTANASKRSLEEELMELRAKQEAELMTQSVPAPSQTRGFDEDLKLELQNKVSNLEIENDSLRREMEKMRLGVSDETGTAKAAPEPAATPVAAAVPMPTEDFEALHAKIKQLEEDVAQKEAENKKIISDKDKLEAYTKRTLAKFQDKYLVALQECKSKLKEKQDKIEALEQRSAAERTAQKREERLLSSTIYELGMAIMQSRLKDR